MNKDDIFHALTTVYLEFAKFSSFMIDKRVGTGVFSKINDPSFNILELTVLDDALFEILCKEVNVPFLCFPARGVDIDAFRAMMKRYHGSHVAEVMANQYTGLSRFQHKNVVPGLEIISVHTKEDLIEFDAISHVTFEHSKGLFVQFMDSLLQKNFNIPEIQLFLGLYEGKPVTTSVLYTPPNDVASIYWGGVLPEYRKRGICTEITAACMLAAKDAGYDIAVCQCMPVAVGFIEKLGFTSLGTLPFYVI